MAEASGSRVSPRPIFVCSFDCGKTFHRKDRLLVHLCSHTGERPFVCSHGDCDKTYSRAAHLQRHVQFAHSALPSTNSVRCRYEGCGITLANAQNLQKHVKRKHEEPPKYMCQVEGCDKICKSHKQRRKHEQSHLPFDPLLCDHENCQKKFSSEAKLQRHKKTHEGFHCRETGCASVFRNFSLLRKHTAVEHSVPFHCPDCERTFIQKSNLKSHMLTHSDARTTLECPHPECGRTYLQNRNLQAHIRSYHDDKRFPCQHPDCPWTFVTKAKMLAHLPLHDPNRPLPKKKHRTKAHRKPRHKKHESAAASLVGIVDGHMKAGSYEKYGLFDPDDSDMVVLSSDESKDEPKKSKEREHTFSSVHRDIAMLPSNNNNIGPSTVNKSEEQKSKCCDVDGAMAMFPNNESNIGLGTNSENKPKEEKSKCSDVGGHIAVEESSEGRNNLEMDISSSLQLNQVHVPNQGATNRQLCGVSAGEVESNKVDTDPSRKRHCSPYDAEAELLSELCKSMIQDPVRRKLAAEDCGYLVTSDSKMETVAKRKRSILVPE